MNIGVRTRAVAASAFCMLCATQTIATTVLVYVSPQEAVVAADSLSNRIEGGQRSVCKIAVVSERMIFVATGTGSTENPHFDPYDLAKAITAEAHTPHEAALGYTKSALAPLQEIWRRNRARYLAIGPGHTKPKGPQDFLFVGLDESGTIAASGAAFVEDEGAPPALRTNKIWDISARTSRDLFFYKSGIVESVPSDNVINRWIQQFGASDALKSAIKLQIKASPDLVGGDVSVVRLRRNGSLEWIDRGACSSR